jgi:hypothetical protein
MESTYVRYRQGCFHKSEGLRVRLVEEMDVCLVYTPLKPRLHTLNLSAWLVLEMCDGRSLRSLQRAYYAAIEPSRSQKEANLEVKEVLDYLLSNGVIAFSCASTESN